jgi:hypothetical protein
MAGCRLLQASLGFCKLFQFGLISAPSQLLFRFMTRNPARKPPLKQSLSGLFLPMSLQAKTVRSRQHSA